MDTQERSHDAADVAADGLEESWLMVEGMDELSGVSGNDGDLTTVLEPAACDWCEEEPAGPGYFVAARQERFRVCPVCWGRAPDYLDLRRDGMEHTEAIRRLCH